MAKRRVYTAEEIDLGLAAFALEGGRKAAVEAQLRHKGVRIPYATVRNWAYRDHEDRYAQIATEVHEQVGRRLADDFHRLARTSTELSDDVLRRISSQLERKDAEYAEFDAKLRAAEATFEDLNKLIAIDQRQLAVSLEIPDADALIEEILDDPGEHELDRVMVARMNSNYKRRAAVVDEIKLMWTRRADAEVSFKELAKLLHESAVMGGISTEKLALLTGHATDRVEHSFPEIQRALEAKGIRLGIGQGAPRALPAPVIDLPADA